MNELSLHILDIAQNSIRANAGLIQIHVKELPDEDLLSIQIKDDGEGMKQHQVKQAENPFFTSRTTRKVGLGIPLLKQNAEQTNGQFQLQSTEKIGTTLTVSFGFHHFDRPIIGDIAGCLLILISNETQADLLYTHQTSKGTFEFDTREIKKELDGIPLSTPEIQLFLKEMILGNLEQIQISE
ncbi:ATP-binding protein [Sunxiuqinia indica]|uniref:ATP-binding protein n=1 Tax=Sunxiuqinia indica TaxID=2692584 RepID=UPI00135A281E|nr:ATP-binding protein [Sunxiuqinia indica]